MADAVDRKQHGVGAADQPLQQPAAFLDTTVVMQKECAVALGKSAQMADLRLPSANIKKR